MEVRVKFFTARTRPVSVAHGETDVKRSESFASEARLQQVSHTAIADIYYLDSESLKGYYDVGY